MNNPESSYQCDAWSMARADRDGDPDHGDVLKRACAAALVGTDDQFKAFIELCRLEFAPRRPPTEQSD